MKMWWTSSALAWKEDFWDAGKAKMYGLLYSTGYCGFRI